ncbi:MULTISPECIES: ATP-binding protein [unclassified Novosphingobium]|uniref:ATP-binding protein n=1 Tax=unclassified Novosphingobium TaxID=2644732 RepID=UPI000D312A88|nr:MULTISPECIES: ATP-binding protein [unclassified Novosphingobium]PTR07742.1 two-component system sensor histidine kinase BaeS/two-component system sensor histidine kinase AdeS [Novosphingobium sp. GV055]PUB00428.1 two-component system sensor histidine kinase BaeS/two-component system sensor histidine kinase AdeS [Novosphingobium sp. GV061]PUB15767.1 two-component system sensor histidine kinase BaeS/two-component system sensor histidine kinase AdeS [Novosphingobium sp. GV079]PUB39454.1 two-com
MMWRTLRLRTQLAAAMILAILLAILFGYVGLNLFARWQEQMMLNALDPVARQTLMEVNAGGRPPAAAAVALYKERVRIAQTIDHEQSVLLIGLAALASMFGIAVGLALATRLARPIEAVSHAARAITSGDLSARAAEGPPGAGELRQLLSDFNSMAEALEAYDRDLREGSAAIAHELRTPLTILRGRLQGQLDGVFATDGPAIAALIQEVDLLARIVEDLQTLSLANTGRLELNVRLADMALLAATHLHALEPILASAGMRLETRLAPTLVEMDEQRLGQVLLALVDNARRHAATGGVVEVETKIDGASALLIITDRGPGLPSHEPDQVFRRFWRGEPSRSRVHGGSGLGLAVVKAVVEAHGGTVLAGDRPDGGAVFHVQLPRQQRRGKA